MSQQEKLDAVARNIIDSNMYLVLGTADEGGYPWVSPVYYASAGYTEFYWVSSPEVRHSHNIAIRPQISIVVFDSQAIIGTGQAVYMSASAQQLAGVDLEHGINVYSNSSIKHGGAEWTPADVQSPALYRLYQATASNHWILDPSSHPDHRIPVL
jgi:nitroimidazol reductase NimA-like FMN-containing flavoprotein (pyridoxamine 5'-phosphate oxidase superfamily)